ncbi:MAG TPA: AI-2E family transporter [Magnetospirillaceae bacterium]
MDDQSDDRFIRRILAILMVALAVLVIWRLSEILVVVFGAVLLSLVLRGIGGKIGSVLGVRTTVAIAAVVLVLVAFVVLLGWLFGSQIHTQFEDIAKRLPEIVDKLEAQAGKEPIGQYIMQQLSSMNFTGATGAAAAHVAHFAKSLTGGVGFLALVFFTGIYIAIQPERYRRGLLTIVPPRRRARATEFLDVAANSLTRWMLAQLCVMIFVGTCVGLGLWAIGVRGAFALGLIDGIFTFVPVIGPIAASIPAILLGLAQSPLLALYTMALYVGVHMLEGYLITPVAQSHAISLPPVVTLFAALSFGLLLGPFAVLFAAPMAVLVMVAFGMFYVEDVLGEKRTWPPGR